MAYFFYFNQPITNDLIIKDLITYAQFIKACTSKSAQFIFGINALNGFLNCINNTY